MKKLWVASFLLLTCCGSAPIYPYYVVDPEKDLLKAADPKDDLKLSETCKPDASDQAKCILQIRAVFFKKERELLETREALRRCEAGEEPDP